VPSGGWCLPQQLLPPHPPQQELPCPQAAPAPPIPNPNNGGKGKGKEKGKGKNNGFGGSGNNDGKGKGKEKGKGKNNGSDGSGNNSDNNSRGTPVWPSFYNPWTSTILMWPGMRPLQQQQQQPAHPPQHALLTAPAYYRALGGPSFTPLPMTSPHQQQAMPPSWSPWICTWDQQSLANSFNTMALTPTAVTNWVADSVASNHIISDAGNLTSVRPPTFIDPSSIVIRNGSALLVTSVGDSALPGLFYLNNVLVTPDIIQNLLFVHRFTTDNWCFMKFDPFGLSVKDLSMRNMITRCNSSGPLYTMCLSSHPTPSSPTSAPSTLVASAST
jgi:hypothetical protein